MLIKFKLIIALSLLLPQGACQASVAFSKSWSFGDQLTVKFESDAFFDYTKDNEVEISAHLPGLNEENGENNEPNLTIVHHYQEGLIQLKQEEHLVEIFSPWKKKLPPDFIHLLYGAARLSWIDQGIFPVHAACIGTEKDGYTLLIGSPGSGKTTITLNAILKQNYKVFSGDKTLLKFNEMNQLEAVSGTRTITVRIEDIWRTLEIPKEQEHLFADRLAFQLPPEFYSNEQVVPIKQIILVTLNDKLEIIQKLNPASALHTLYPFFMDKQREDILIESNQAFFDGAVKREIREELAKNLKTALEDIPVYKVVASLQKVTEFIQGEKKQDKKELKKILFGICGISNGHCSRQMPIIKHMLNEGHEVLIFTYGDGLNYFNDRFAKNSRLQIIPVANPYYVGTPEGIDFELTANSENNRIDFTKINSLSMHQASIEFGIPNLVISDYEMVAAEYAYAKNIPLITLDQQSKYLVGNFSIFLNGTSYVDEVERLSLFFPKAKKRIAVSFFQVEKANRKEGFEVEVLSPMIRPEVLAAKNIPLSDKPSILVYVTAQQLGFQPVDEWILTIKKALPNDYEAHLFLPKRTILPKNDSQMSFYHHGDKKFDPVLFACHGIITTAGHNLLSEAMYLEKPVLALPLPLYEQQLNAHMIEKGEFGLSRDHLSIKDLLIFFANLNTYKKNIAEDTKYLLKEPGNDLIIEKIDRILYE